MHTKTSAHKSDQKCFTFGQLPHHEGNADLTFEGLQEIDADIKIMYLYWYEEECVHLPWHEL